MKSDLEPFFTAGPAPSVAASHCRQVWVLQKMMKYFPFFHFNFKFQLQMLKIKPWFAIIISGTSGCLCKPCLWSVFNPTKFLTSTPFYVNKFKCLFPQKNTIFPRTYFVYNHYHARISSLLLEMRNLGVILTLLLHLIQALKWEQPSILQPPTQPCFCGSVLWVSLKGNADP